MARQVIPIRIPRSMLTVDRWTSLAEEGSLVVGQNAAPHIKVSVLLFVEFELLPETMEKLFIICNDDG